MKTLNSKAMTSIKTIIAVVVFSTVTILSVPAVRFISEKIDRTEALAECSYTAKAVRNQIISDYADSEFSQTSFNRGNIKKITDSHIKQSINSLADTGGKIIDLWIDEKNLEPAGFTYITQNQKYYVIYAPDSETSSYIFSSDDYYEYKEKLSELEKSGWK